MEQRPKSDDRRDNVEKIQKNISETIKNMEMTEDMINSTSDPNTKNDLHEKNKRRRDALKGLRREIKDEADARDRGYRE